ncbi:MAG: pitrilysin family protein [Acidobacteriota bacterium]
MSARSRSVVPVLLLAVAAAASIVVAQAPPAQEPPSSKAVVMKGKAPVSTQVLQVKLPRPLEADLPNGLHLMVLEDRRSPQVTFQLIIPGAGGYFDPADQAGLAQFTASQLREGTTTRTSQQIAEQLERMAASAGVGASLSGEDAALSGSCLTEHLDAVLDLGADMLLNPTFPEAEWTRYKAQARAQYVQLRSSPGFLASELFSRMMFGTHPASRVSPTPESLDRTTRDAMVAFHQARYVPDHAVFAVAGDITLAEARKKIEARFGPWTKAGTPRPAVSDPPALDKGGIALVARPGSVQTNLLVGAQGISRTSPDYYVLTVLNQVIGGGPSGRLFRHLREEKGYTYGAYSNLSSPRHTGVWQANTQVRTDVTEAALRDLLDELRQARDIPVPAQEFADAKRTIVASFALTLESPGAILANHVTRWRYGFPADYWDRYPERIMAVTTAEVQAAAKKYLEPGRVQVVAVGNGDVLGPVLRKLGAVEMYDTEGRKVGGQ